MFWAMLDNEKYASITLHWMDDNIDTGQIIIQEKIIIEPYDTLFALYEKVFSLLPRLFFLCIKKIKKEKICREQARKNILIMDSPHLKRLKGFIKQGKK